MSGFDDLFAGVTFPDAKIQVSGPPAGNGQTSDSQPDTGQKTDSQPVQAKDTPVNKPTKDNPDASKGDSDKGKEAKPLPFDQDPKWKKARLAEKTLQEVMDTHGYLDVEELKEALESGKNLKSQLEDSDLETLKKNAAAYKEYKKRMEESENSDDDQVPDDKMKKILEENKQLKSTLEEINETRRNEEATAESFKNYKTDVDRILELMSDEVPLNDVESILFKAVMGIDNPSTAVDINNRQEVRTMVKNAAKQFKTTLEAIKQNAIDEFAKGKSAMRVTDPTKSADSDSPILNQKNYDLEKQSTNEIFDSGKEELYELLRKGIEAAQ